MERQYLPDRIEQHPQILQNYESIPSVERHYLYDTKQREGKLNAMNLDTIFRFLLKAWHASPLRDFCKYSCIDYTVVI